MKAICRLLVCLMILCIAVSGTAETVTFQSFSADSEAEYLNLDINQIKSWDRFYEFLDQFPNLKKVDMFDVLVYNKAVEKFERYKNLETLAKGNAFLSGIIAKELKEIQRVIDEYSKKIARYNNEELESFIYRYQPKRANPFMAIGNRF